MSNVAGENKRKVKKTKTDTTNIKVSTEDRDDPIQTNSNEKKSDEKKKKGNNSSKADSNNKNNIQIVENEEEEDVFEKTKNLENELNKLKLEYLKSQK